MSLPLDGAAHQENIKQTHQLALEEPPLSQADRERGIKDVEVKQPEQEPLNRGGARGRGRGDGLHQSPRQGRRVIGRDRANARCK